MMADVGTIDDYLGGLEPSDAAVIGHIYDVARAEVPEAEQGKGYGMPALTYAGKPLLSVMRTKKHIGIYPFSGDAVLAALDLLEDPDTSKGTIRFQPQSPPSDEAIRTLVRTRRAQIDP